MHAKHAKQGQFHRVTIARTFLTNFGGALSTYFQLLVSEVR
jgi:hypothetical protein